jgi:hypothetical protein
MSRSKLVVVRGHALKSIRCDGTVPNRAHAECECGWMCITYSSVRARDAHRDHKLAIAAVEKATHV